MGPHNSADIALPPCPYIQTEIGCKLFPVKNEREYVRYFVNKNVGFVYRTTQTCLYIIINIVRMS